MFLDAETHLRLKCSLSRARRGGPFRSRFELHGYEGHGYALRGLSFRAAGEKSFPQVQYSILEYSITPRIPYTRDPNRCHALTPASIGSTRSLDSQQEARCFTLI